MNIANDNGRFISILSDVTVELDKFVKQENEIESDLDKLLFTMKNLHNVIEASQFPKFWNE